MHARSLALGAQFKLPLRRTLLRVFSGLGVLLALGLTGCAVIPPPAATRTEIAGALTGELTVFTAASLADGFAALGGAFEAQYPGTVVHFGVAGSQKLAAQLDEGAQADLFASAGRSQIDLVIAGGRITPSSVEEIAYNQLVIITPVNNPAAISSLADLARPGLRLILADAAVPAGQYTAELLRRAEADPAFGIGFAAAVQANAISHESSARAVLAKIQLGEADAGIVYRSDVIVDPNRVSAVEIPEDLNPRAVYWLAPLNDSARPALAAAFRNFVRSPNGQAILARYGFVSIDP